MKPIVKDYLISLLITVLICVIIIGIDNYPGHSFTLPRNRIQYLINSGKNIANSKEANLFAGEYKLNIGLSRIDSSRMIPDSILWVEKYSLRYYKENEKSETFHLADSVKDNYILHIDNMLKDNSPEPKTIGNIKHYTALIKNKSTNQKLGDGCNNCI